MRKFLRTLLALSAAALITTSLLPPSSRVSAQAPKQGAAAAGDAGAELSAGKSLLRRGRAAEALVRLERALELYRQGRNRSGEAAAHDLLGELYERQGQYEVALGHFRQALEIFVGGAADTERARETAAAASSIATPVAGVAGTASKAVVNFDAFHANLMLSKIGNMHYRRGRVAEARQAFARMQVRKPDTSGLGKAKGFGKMLGGIGIGLGSDNRSVQVGAPTLGSALTVKDRFEVYHQTIIYATQEIGMGRISYRGGNFDAARGHFDNALQATKGDLPFLGDLGQSRRFRAAARTGLADVALRQGRHADAVKLFQEAAKGAEKDRRLDLMWPAQRGTARARWLQAARERDAKKADKLRQESLAAYRDALKTIETIRQGSIRADESRTVFLATTKDVFEEAAAAFAEMALAASTQTGAPLSGKSLEYADEGFRVVEQGRARSLLDLLSETGGEITEGVPAALLERKQENLDRQNEIATQLTGVSASAEAPDKGADELEKELDALQVAYDRVENEIRQASPRYNALTAGRPLSLAEVQQQILDDSTALLEYALGEDASYLWVVVRDRAALYKLPPRAAVNQQASDLRDQIVPAKLRRSLVATSAEAQRGLTHTDAAASLQAAGFSTAASALYKTVLEPAAPFYGDRRLIVAADGALAYVPFEALVTSTGGADFASLPYLIKTNEVAYTPSASVIAAVRQQGQASSSAAAPNSILLIADPVFDPADPRLRGQKTQAGAGDAAASNASARELTLQSAVQDVSPVAAKSAEGLTPVRLTGTRTEAEQAAAAARAAGMRADLWLDLEASEENAAARDLKDYRIVHFATHGLLNTERPQFTGLVLSLVGNRERDGFLRTDEVFNLKLGRPLVMLSACETGLGRERRGEGVIGLTRAFMYAGAPSVGVTLWPVADRSTAELMADFYKRLLGGANTPSSALRAARLQMISGGQYAAPYYWAPFVLVGDWR